MEHLEGILRLVDSEFKTIDANGKFRSRDEVEHVYKLMDIAKDIYCIWAYEQGMEDEYSENSYARESYRGRSNNDGYSMARNRRRTRDGRYASRNDYADYADESYRSYRRGNYSRDDAKEEYIGELRELMQNAPDENARMSIQRMIQQMEKD